MCLNCTRLVALLIEGFCFNVRACRHPRFAAGHCRRHHLLAVHTMPSTTAAAKRISCSSPWALVFPSVPLRFLVLFCDRCFDFKSAYYSTEGAFFSFFIHFFFLFFFLASQKVKLVSTCQPTRPGVATERRIHRLLVRAPQAQ